MSFLAGGGGGGGGGTVLCSDAPVCQVHFEIAGAVFAAIALGLQIWLAVLHFRRWEAPAVQTWTIVVIACMSAWSVLFFLLIVFPAPTLQSPIIEVFTSCVEALYITAFVLMIVEYLGGWANMRTIADTLPETSGLFFIRYKPTWRKLRVMLGFIFQFTIIIPCVAIITAITDAYGLYLPAVLGVPNAWLPMLVIRFVSLFILLVALTQLYRAIRYVVVGARLIRKFFVQKVFLTLIMIEAALLSGAEAIRQAPVGSSVNDPLSKAYWMQLLGVIVLIEIAIFSGIMFWSHSTKLAVHKTRAHLEMSSSAGGIDMAPRQQVASSDEIA